MKICVIVGPTAVGKTKYAIEAAQLLNGEVVSADSMQIYKGLDIGSAKPTSEEQSMAKHHLIDFVDPLSDYSVAEYQLEARMAIMDIASKDKVPIIAGGTGLYVNAVLYNMDFSVLPKQQSKRDELEDFAREHGAEALYIRLIKQNPEAAQRVHKNNVKKVIRALEVLEMAGEPIRPFSDSFVPYERYEPVIIGLNRNRDELYGHIEKRVDRLMEEGLISEVESLRESGLSKEHIAVKGIGYKELYGYLDGEYDLDQAIYLIKRNSKRYAKRQITWFKRYPDIKWFNFSDYPSEDEFNEDFKAYLRSVMK